MIDEVEATIVDLENENKELELSFRVAGEVKAYDDLQKAYEEKTNIKVKVCEANKGGLIIKYKQISGFLPVSQLSPDNYPRVGGGDKGKILEKLKKLIAKEFEVKILTYNPEANENQIVFSEKEVWNENKATVISKYKVGTIIEGTITALTNFGIFVNFGENLEGLIHISELAWQRIDNPADFYKIGDQIRAEVVSVENSKIFLSSKKLSKNPWEGIEEKYQLDQEIEGTILKINNFGLFVSLDKDIHGLAHISELNLAPDQKIKNIFQEGQKLKFKITSLSPEEYRLGLGIIENI